MGPARRRPIVALEIHLKQKGKESGMLHLPSKMRQAWNEGGYSLTILGFYQDSMLAGWSHDDSNGSWLEYPVAVHLKVGPWPRHLRETLQSGAALQREASQKQPWRRFSCWSHPKISGLNQQKYSWSWDLNGEVAIQTKIEFQDGCHPSSNPDSVRKALAPRKQTPLENPRVVKSIWFCYWKLWFLHVLPWPGVWTGGCQDNPTCREMVNQAVGEDWWRQLSLPGVASCYPRSNLENQPGKRPQTACS